MESLRWILLAAGAVFVLVVYMLGRSRRQRNHSTVDELEDNLPAFSAKSFDDIDEGVGEVRIISNSRAEDDLLATVPDAAADGIIDSAVDVADTLENDIQVQNQVELETHTQAEQDTPAEKEAAPSDIIVLYILTKPGQTLLGSQINSSAQAMGLSFGEMNIFHFNRNGRNVFSMANMLEPGSFDPETIHDLKTTGLTVFMQIQATAPQSDPLDDLTEMLQRSYQLAGLLDARLCSHQREPLTAQDAENYRQQVSEFSALALSS